LLFCSGITTVTAATAASVRSISGNLLQLESTEVAEGNLQFGIKHLLIWTTIVAVITPIIQWLEFSGNGRDLQIVGTLTLAYSLVAVFQIWAFLHHRFDLKKMIACLSMVATAGAVVVWMFGDVTFWLVVTFISQFMVAGSLYCLRMQDYRFVRR
jgi:Na+/melibiose symporter-like transporter